MSLDPDANPLASSPTYARGGSWYRVWLPRTAVTTILVVTLIYGSQWVFGSTADFLVLLLVSTFVAFALLPAVEALSRRGWRRGPATAVVMFGSAVLATVFVLALTQVVIGEVIKLVEKAPEYAESFATWLSDTFGFDIDIDNFVAQLTADRERLTELASDAFGGILGLASTTLGLVFQGLTIALFVFYILADLPRLRAAILRRFPPGPQLHIDTVTTITIEKVGGYVYSRALLALFSAAFHLVVFLVIGLPYALAMALWVGLVSQFIPTIGTYLAGAVPVLIALLEQPIDAVWVILAVTVYQQVENYFLSPRITANTMDLHPALAFGSVIVGGALLGGVGALLALPAVATLAALVTTYTDHYEIVSRGPIESPEDYEHRMRAVAAEKAAKKRARYRRLFGRFGPSPAPGD